MKASFRSKRENLSDNNLRKSSPDHQPQLQKMVTDIKKNDDSLFNRLKRFQTEQTANILRTGRNQLDKMKNKAPPEIPARDYLSEELDPDRWSECESDTYEDPQDDQDDYESPPSERVFAPRPSLSYGKGEYLDSCRRQQNPTSWQQQRPGNACRSRPSPKKAAADEEDYIHPEDDNYITPTGKGPSDPSVTRGAQLGSATRSDSQDVYELPDAEDESPSLCRSKSSLRAPAQILPPIASPRFTARKSFPPQEQDTDDQYEICAEEFKEQPKPSIPIPLSREVRSPQAAPREKPSASAQESGAQPMILPRKTVNTMTASPPAEFLRAKMPLPQQCITQKQHLVDKRSPEENRANEAEENSALYKKTWYASTCSRKIAEDALLRADKDGSFLVRKSSGQVAQQPYTLVVFYNSRVFNIPIRYIPSAQQYALGSEKRGEERFSSVSCIIENHQTTPLVLIDTVNDTRDYARLKYPVKP